ncbi:MAG: hypothetical protein ACKVOJ_00255 [Sphingomonadaceae bacterium]
MKRAAFALLSLILLASCASPESRLRAGLENAGLSQPIAGCMAHQMIGRLSLIQLRRLSSLSNFQSDSLRDMSIDRFLHNVRALKDPEVLEITSKAGIGCVIAQ